MSILEITDASVIAAVEEFDRIGRDVFLQKYGFGRARSYFLAYKGNHYDSKAIIGAAHAHQAGVPLKSDEFTGGEQTVARKLESLGFEISRLLREESGDGAASPSPRNATWSRDELIVALAAYVRWEGNPPGKTSNEIAELSEFLNSLQRLLGSPTSATFRNTNGVYMKLMNFRRFDPKYLEQGKAGLARGGRLEEEVWNTYQSDPARLRQTADAIRHGASTVEQQLGDRPETPEYELAGLEEAEEGRLLSVQHLRRERSPQLAKAKKDRVLRSQGRLECEVCHFDFHAAYGTRGHGFIECHHVMPLASMSGAAKTCLEDLALLCANCHRMIHVRRPWLSLEALRGMREPVLESW